MTQTAHPEELLAEYVDGTLDERDRRAVEAHLVTCHVCRHEVGLAGGARQMLQRLPEEPVPLGVTGRVVEQAGRRSSRTGREAPPWGHRVQWAAGIAVAAALVAVVAVSLPNLGDGTSDEGAPTADTAAEAAAGRAGGSNATAAAPEYAFDVSLEQVDRDLDDKALRKLATSVAEAVRKDTLAAPADAGTAEETEEALECIGTWAGATGDEVLVRLLQARYLGQDAYVAVYLTGPGVGEAPTRATVWVASTGDCRFLDITYTNI